MRIPDLNEVVSRWSDVRLDNDESVEQHVGRLREAFVREHAGRFINTRQALDFVREHLPYLPATEQAGVAKQLVEDADQRVHWPVEGGGNRRGLTGAQLRERQEIVLRALGEFIEEARSGTLGVDDLARSLDLLRCKPLGRSGAQGVAGMHPSYQSGFDGTILHVGEHLVTVLEVPSVAVHQPCRPGAQRETYGDVTRQGDQLAFTGWVPSNDGYLQVQTRIDAERSDGPLTERERTAVSSLATTLRKAFVADFVPTRHLQWIGSEAAGQGVIARPFDRYRALANGAYVRTPEGEGSVQHAFTDGRPSTSSFSVGPVFFSVLHGAPAHRFDRSAGRDSSFQVLSHEHGNALQVQVSLRNGDTAYATLTNQPSRQAAERQLHDVLALADKVFS